MNQVYIWSFYFMFSGKSSQTGHNVVMPTCYAYSHEFYTIVFMFWYVFSQSQPLCSGVLQNNCKAFKIMYLLIPSLKTYIIKGV